MIAGLLHLCYRPGAKCHASDLTVIKHTFASFPVSCCRVILCKASAYSFIKCIVNSIWASSVSSVREWIFSFTEDVVYEIRITCCTAVNVGIPCCHSPACCKVCIQRDRVCVIFDFLKIIKELIRCFWKLCNSCFFKHCLVVNNSLYISHRRKTINLITECIIVQHVTFIDL